MKKKLLWIIPIAIVGLPAFIALGGWAVRELWNWLLPPLFGWHQITFWQALGMLALCRILFGGWGGHGGPGSRRRWHKDRNWDRMTPEEREQFRERMRDRCGFGPAKEENAG